MADLIGSRVLLHSPQRPARWTYFLTHPVAEFRARKNSVEIIRRGKSLHKKCSDPLRELESFFKQQRRQVRAAFDPDGPPFQGGAVGYLSYEALHYLEDVPLPQEDDARVPWLDFFFFDSGVAFDHWEKKFHVFGPAAKRRLRMDGLETALHDLLSGTLTANGRTGRVSSNFSKSAYLTAVRKAKEHIAAGETFQANVSQRFQAQTTRTPWSVFLRLNEINPSPYSAFFQSGVLSIVSGSPELLFSLQSGRILTRPIKGTRPRGSDASDDARLEREMVRDAKERAENAMIVDLERNDLGRICTAGSVRVTDAFAVEKYSHVQHMVSNVEGRLLPDATAFDALRALFPGGSITGCPKVRTMQLLREIEPVARGPYTGSLGWIGWNGDAAFNILIRTLYFKKEKGNAVHLGKKKKTQSPSRSSDSVTGAIWRAYFHAGGGIVWDSSPEKEYAESLQKAEAMRQALVG
ncbi:anthranilate synthase component I family protein [Candidatus Micrarchaeota archaeon]|nr:anthranilate synthase component I family protein [Candidatus Micrarchaeota archaeon]